MIGLLKLALGVGVILAGWTLTALLVERRENLGRNADWIGITGALAAVLIGGWILTTI